LTLVLVVVYLNGLRNWKQRSRPHSRWRTLSFLVGSAAIVFALMSPLDHLAERYFLMHQIQHILIRMVGPVLIMLGAPITPVLRGIPVSTRTAVVRPAVTSVRMRTYYSLATNPLIVVVSFVGIFIFWLIPGPHDTAVTYGWIHFLMHGTLFSVSMMFWWEIIDPKPRRSRMHYGVRTLVLGLVAIPNTIASAGITFANTVLYRAYTHMGLDWSLEPIVDQQSGGVVGWLVVDMMSVLGAGIVFGKWYQHELSASNKIAHRARRNKST